MSESSRFMIPLNNCGCYNSYMYFNTLDRCLYVFTRKVHKRYILSSGTSDFLGFNIHTVFCNRLELYCNLCLCLVELGNQSLVGFRCSEDTLISSVKKERTKFNSYFYVTSDEWRGSDLWQKSEFMADCLIEGVPANNVPKRFLSREMLRDDWGRVLEFMLNEVSIVLSIKYGTNKKKVLDIIGECSGSISLSDIAYKLKEYNLGKIEANLRRSSLDIDGVLSVTLVSMQKVGKDVEDMLLELCLPSSMPAVEYLSKLKLDESFRKRFVDSVISNALRYVNKGKSADSTNLMDRRYLAVKRLLPRGYSILVTVGLRSDILEVKRKLEEQS